MCDACGNIQLCVETCLYMWLCVYLLVCAETSVMSVDMSGYVWIHAVICKNMIYTLNVCGLMCLNLNICQDMWIYVYVYRYVNLCVEMWICMEAWPCMDMYKDI